jgi:predicted O-methyltransferase YrrM
MLAIAPQLFFGFLQAMISDKRRGIIGRIGMEVKASAGRIPSVSLHEIPGVRGTSIITDLSGSAVIALIAKAIGAKRVFEFGTNLGSTTMAIAENCPTCTIHTLDLPDDLAFDFKGAQTQSTIEITDEYLFHKNRGSLIKGEAAKRIVQLRQDSSTFDPAIFEKEFDLIYIDASHSYSAVKSDTQKALVMLKPQGLIVWDDYHYPGVWQYLNEFAKERPSLRYIKDWNKVIMWES